jgi:hypothetical protein
MPAISFVLPWQSIRHKLVLPWQNIRQKVVDHAVRHFRLMSLVLLGFASTAIAASRVTIRADEAERPSVLWIAGEPSLHISARRTRVFEGYRFQWQTLNGQIKVFRLIKRPDGSGVLSVRELVGEKTLLTKTKIVSASELSLLRAYLRVADFSRLPVEPIADSTSGNRWTIEAAREGNFRWLTRVAPRDQYFMNAALYLVRLSGLDTQQFYQKDPKTGWTHG